MIKKELKFNLKSTLIWSGICIILFGLVFAVYPTIISNLGENSFDEMLKAFPPELLKAFNMDISSMDSAYGYFTTEGGVFLYLILGMFAGVLGTNILLKEKSDMTIEYLGSKPISRTKIVNSKVLVGLIYVVASVVIVAIFNFVGFELSAEYNKMQLIIISFSVLQTAIPSFFICLLLSLFFKKSKSTTFISVGLIIFSYFLSVFSTFSQSVEFLKYFSLFTLSNLRHIVENTSIFIPGLIVSIIISIICYILTLIIYNKKQLI